MIDEELENKAKQYSSKYARQYYHNDKSGLTTSEEEVCKAYIAGAKENGVVWHDLRKNPDDLPKKVGNYIVCYLDTMLERHTFELSYVDYLVKEHWVDVCNHNIEKYDEGVIAWCEIPKYTEE